MFTSPFFSPKARDTFLSSCFLKRFLSASMLWGYATKLLMRNSIDPCGGCSALARFTNHDLGIIDCPTPNHREDGLQDGRSSIGQVIGFDRKATRSASLRGPSVPRRWLSPLSRAPATVYSCTAVYWSMAYWRPWIPAFNVPLVTMPHSASSGLNELTGWSVPAESEAPSSSQA